MVKVLIVIACTYITKLGDWSTLAMLLNTGPSKIDLDGC